jgi:glycerol kinase
VAETTALGAAYAAGLATGVWASLDDLRANWGEDRRWVPAMTAAERTAKLAKWKMAVDRSLDWA